MVCLKHQNMCAIEYSPLILSALRALGHIRPMGVWYVVTTISLKKYYHLNTAGIFHANISYDKLKSSLDNR